MDPTINCYFGEYSFDAFVIFFCMFKYVLGSVFREVYVGRSVWGVWAGVCEQECGGVWARVWGKVSVQNN